MLDAPGRTWFDTFFQTNPTQAEKLVELALEMADAKEHERMIDLFCGVGTFSLPFAAKVKELAGIEIVESSIESAKRNAVDNGIDNTYFLAKDARRGMDEILETCLCLTAQCCIDAYAECSRRTCRSCLADLLGAVYGLKRNSSNEERHGRSDAVRRCA